MQPTPEQSLLLIEGMIAQAKRSFSRNSFYFMLWGALLIAAMVCAYLLRGNTPGIAHGVPWTTAGVLGGIISGVYGSRQAKDPRVSNPMDRMIGWLWGGYVITLLLLIICSVALRRDPGPAILLLTGLPTFLTGTVMRFRPLVFGGVLFWVAGVALHLVTAPLGVLMIYSAAMLFGYIVPGYLLKLQEDDFRSA